ncbi:hypothetical protein CLV40_112127 [Actinokineospora auranticolor]|uniref:Uncharacterized protein n=1 Tax=Actinokineospora auranticolor TaxID=155976 RepID=A0A2S6GKY0_9PSEU|nr:hypothetical protein CLV40_112127 [Actinokineospora auranticolor]
MDTVVYLDRLYLTGLPGDPTISRQPHAPSLCHRAGDWWLDNYSQAHNAYVAVHPRHEQGRIVVPLRCSVRLGDGDSEVWVWSPQHRLRLRVAGSAFLSAQREQEDDVSTEVGVPGAHDRVTELWKRVPFHRVVLAAYYRPYFAPGLVRPAPQNREQTRRCVGQPTCTRLDRALRETMNAIWGEQGHAAELPEYLISQRLLNATDQGLVPHTDCAHRRSQ